MPTHDRRDTMEGLDGVDKRKGVILFRLGMSFDPGIQEESTDILQCPSQAWSASCIIDLYQDATELSTI